MTRIRNIWNNLRLLSQHPTSIMVGVFAGMLLALTYLYFTQQGNLYWAWITYDPWWLSTWKIAQQIITVFWFGIFVSTQVYRWLVYRKTSKSDTFLWTLGSILIAIVAWCPTCGFTLAGTLGIASVFTANWLPWGWEEIKLIGTLLLLWVVYHSLTRLNVCKVSPK